MGELADLGDARDRSAMHRRKRALQAEIAGLEDQRDELTRRVEDLRAFEREYRSRLKAWLADMQAELAEPATR